MRAGTYVCVCVCVCMCVRWGREYVVMGEEICGGGRGRYVTQGAVSHKILCTCAQAGHTTQAGHTNQSSTHSTHTHTHTLVTGVPIHVLLVLLAAL